MGFQLPVPQLVSESRISFRSTVLPQLIRNYKSGQPPGMYKNPVNNGISTTCPSSGERIPDFFQQSYL